jgi:hypothetical protein
VYGLWGLFFACSVFIKHIHNNTLFQDLCRQRMNTQDVPISVNIGKATSSKHSSTSSWYVYLTSWMCPQNLPIYFKAGWVSAANLWHGHFYWSCDTIISARLSKKT